jgi:hypothetical protein
VASGLRLALSKRLTDERQTIHPSLRALSFATCQATNRGSQYGSGNDQCFDTEV